MFGKRLSMSLCALACAAAIAADGGAQAPSPTAGSAGTTMPDATTSSPSVGLLPLLPASEAGARVISLDEAIASALSGNDDLAIAQGNLQAARAANAANLAKAAPSLSGSASAGVTDGFGNQTQAKSLGASGIGLGESFSGGLSFAEGTATQSSGTRIGLTATHSIPVTPQLSSSGTSEIGVSSSTSLVASISQTVWDGYKGGQTKAVIDKSLLALQGKELAARQAGSAATTKVKQAYIAALSAQRTLALRLGILDKQRSLLKQIQATYAIKQASAIDLKTAQINARSAELDVESGRHDYALARQRLAILIGLPPDSDFRVAEIAIPKPPAATLEEAVAKGLANRADIAQYDLAGKSSAIDLALAQGSAQPSLVVSGGVGLGYSWGTSSGPTVVDPSNGQSISLGLKVGLPILDAGAARAAADAAKAAAGVAAIQAKQLAKNVAADIRDAWWNLQILAERTDLAGQSVDLAESQLTLTREQVKFGTATNQDLMTAAVNAANAEAAWLAAKSNQLLAELTLETAMGI